MAKRHSAVCYVFRDGGFSPVEDAKPFPNGLGLDLFVYKGHFYEGKSGLCLCPVCGEPQLRDVIDRNGGPARLEKQIADSVEKNGLSPRYTRPEETKKQVFLKVKDENMVLAKDLSGKKHYFYRFHNEDGIELFTMKKNDEFFATVYVPCEGYMVGIDQKHRLEEILKWLPTLEGGIKGEIEKRFNESLEYPGRWADFGYAALLGRVDEAEAHNAPIREERERRSQQEKTARAERERAEEIRRGEEYHQAIAKAEQDILSGGQVLNTDIQGKSLVMQLFREHEIAVPLKTQGWIIKSLHSIYYSQTGDFWNYRYGGNDSTVFRGLMIQLIEAVKTKEQFAAAVQCADGDFNDFQPDAEDMEMER